MLYNFPGEDRRPDPEEDPRDLQVEDVDPEDGEGHEITTRTIWKSRRYNR